MKDIRHFIGGHFEKGFTKYYETIKILEKDQSIKAIEHFLGINKTIMLYLETVVKDRLGSDHSYI